MTGIKYFALSLIVFGITLFRYSGNEGSYGPLLAGLFILYVTREKKQDERAVSLKASSAYISLVISYAVARLGDNLFEHRVIGVHLESINHFLILVFALALVIYHSRMLIFSR